MEKRKLAVIERARKLGSWNLLNAEQRKFLEEIDLDIEALFDARARSYSDQVSVLNQYLWKRLFHPSIRDQVPELYMVALESVFLDVTPQILRNPEHILFATLFDPGFRAKALDLFDGIPGAWDSRTSKGTHFFWRRTPSNRLESLHLDGNFLCNADGSARYQLEPERLIELIEQNQITPNLLLLYSHISFWCGCHTLNSLASVSYVTEMKAAWLRLLQNTRPEEYKLLKGVNTKTMVGGYVAYERTASKHIRTQSALDVVYHGGMQSDYLERLFEVPFHKILEPALIDFLEAFARPDFSSETKLQQQRIIDDTFSSIVRL